MDKFLNIYLKPKEGVGLLNQLNWGYKELLLKVVLPFSLFAPVGYLIGFTILKDYYIKGINEFIEFLKADPKADKETLEYMNQILNMLSDNEFSKIIVFIIVIWIFELLRPLILNGIVFFFARSFGGDVTNQKKTFTLTVFSLVPMWVAGVFNMMNSPVTTFLIFLASFYTFYLIFIGSEKILNIPSKNSKNFQFIIVVVIFNLIISGILGMVQTEIIKKLIS